MRRLVVLGAGTAGTALVNVLRHEPTWSDWDVVVVDRDDAHVYQPGLLLLPFGVYAPHQLVRPRRRFLPDGVRLVLGEVHSVDTAGHVVALADGTGLPYDVLVVATGTTPRPEQTPGMTGAQWRRSVFDFYTLDGATALREALRRFRSGRLVVHVAEMPVKCPVAPLEFAFLADAHLREAGVRDRVDLTYVTPLDAAFTKPVAARRLGGMLEDRRIALEPDFVVDRVEEGRLVSFDDREVPFDLLVTVPVNMGADFVGRTPGLGDELDHVLVDRRTLQALVDPDVFAIGDAADVPTSKAGSVAHFEVDVLAANLLAHARGLPLPRSFDGHANCFVETGHGKAMLLDFNYDVEPLPGTFPLPVAGPFTLLRESRRDHWGKLAFRWAYWHLLLRGRPLPVPTAMSMSGKRTAA